jgi:hypothetical protein
MRKLCQLAFDLILVGFGWRDCTYFPFRQACQKLFSFAFKTDPAKLEHHFSDVIRGSMIWRILYCAVQHLFLPIGPIMI